MREEKSCISYFQQLNDKNNLLHYALAKLSNNIRANLINVPKTILPENNTLSKINKKEDFLFKESMKELFS